MPEELFEVARNKIDVIEGVGAVTADGNVRVGDDEIEANTVILATGSWPGRCSGSSSASACSTPSASWALRELPQKMAVIGAGASGAEIASAYGRLGVEVTLLEALPQILPLEDEEIAKAAAREIRKQNVKIVTDANVESAEVSDDGVELTYGDGETERFDYLAIAAGRGPDVEGLGLEDAGVTTGENGRVEVDGRMRTSADGVYAIGDLVPGPALAHKASDEGVIAAEDAAGLETHALDYGAIPAATFCHPQVASFGMTEKQARDAGYDVVIGKVPMGAVGAPTVYGDRTGMIKIVGDKRYGEILGAHMAGARATDLISELVAVHDLEGGFAEVARIVHPHPTFSEATLEAARSAWCRCGRRCGSPINRRPGTRTSPVSSSAPPLRLRAATFAAASGRVVAFSLAALRQAFAAGRDLSQVDNVLIAAAACELHPRAVLKAIESRSVAERLSAVSAEAATRLVGALPAIAVAGKVSEGPAAVETAATSLAASS